jgi:hypothetical protein
MDLPLYLEARGYVYRAEQAKQTLLVILKNYFGSFTQSYALGSMVSIHQPVAVMEEAIRDTIKVSLPLLDVQRVEVGDDHVYITINGFGELATYDFSKASILEEE